MDIVFAVLSPHLCTLLPYSVNERDARWYAEFLELEDYAIQEFREEDIESIAEKNDLVASEISEVYDGLWLTEDDLDFISNTAEDECQQLYMKLKQCRKIIKVIKGKSSEKLLKAIKEFFDERVKSEEFEVDESDPVDRLVERIKLKKFSKTLLQSTHCDKE